jgi:hypothetical protein
VVDHRLLGLQVRFIEFAGEGLVVDAMPHAMPSTGSESLFNGAEITELVAALGRAAAEPVVSVVDEKTG